MDVKWDSSTILDMCEFIFQNNAYRYAGGGKTRSRCTLRPRGHIAPAYVLNAYANV